MKKFLVTPDFKISRAMKKISETGERCLIVINNEKKLLGTISDGDIRRAILKGININENIKSIYSKKPSVLLEGQHTIGKAKKLFNYYKSTVLPIVDLKNNLVDCLTWEQTFGVRKKNKSLTNVPVVIMAGGKGARLAPFTKVLPKPLIPINDKTVIEHIIGKFTLFGVRNYFLTVNYKSLILKSFFKELDPNYSVTFLDETKPLGTVGGLNSYKRKFKKTFFVTNCDIIIDIDYHDLYRFHKKNKNYITLVASAKDFKIPYGVCNLDDNGQLSKISEKPKQNVLANTGLYVLEPEALDLIPKKKLYHMTQLIHDARKKNKRIGIYPISETSWLDVGEWSEYRKTLKKIP